MTTAQLNNWKKANPWILVNISSIGTMCGRYPTVEAAKEEIERRGDRFVAVQGREVLFSGKVYL